MYMHLHPNIVLAWSVLCTHFVVCMQCLEAEEGVVHQGPAGLQHKEWGKKNLAYIYQHILDLNSFSTLSFNLPHIK